MAAKPERLLLGDIGRPQGLKGEVRIRSFTEVPASIASYGPLEDESGRRTIEFESVRTDGKGLVARIKGVATREAAEALTGTKLYLAKERLPGHGEEEWYHSELIGLDALDSAGVKLGTVVAAHNFGAGDLIEIAPEAGGATLLVPFTRDAVPEVDVEGGWLKVVPPEMIE